MSGPAVGFRRPERPAGGPLCQRPVAGTLLGNTRSLRSRPAPDPSDSAPCRRGTGSDMSEHARPTGPLASYATVRASRAQGGGGAYLGTTSDGWVWSGDEHAVLVLGPPRSGKTSALVVPSVVAAAGAVICTSTKPDVATVTAPVRRRTGPCLLYDPSGTVPPVPGVEAVRWSPIPSCRRWDDALVMADSMVDAAGRAAGRSTDGGHWTERAGALLAPLLHAAALQHADMGTVLRWVDCHQAGPAMAALDAAGAEVAADLLAGIAATDHREQSGIWSTASGTLQAYRSHAALRTTAAPDFDAAALLDAGATVYVCASARQQAVMAPLVVGLLTDVRAAVYARAAAWEAAGRPTVGGGRPTPALFALDEVANIAPIPDLPGMVSEAGGQGLTVLACLQDLSQARRRWGADAEGFLSLFGSTVVLPGIGDVRTLQAISTLAGDADVVHRSVTTPVAAERRRLGAVAGRIVLGPSAAERWPRTPSATLATARRRRLPVEAIAQGRPGAALLLDQRNRTRWLGLTPWFSSAPWRDVVDGSPIGRRPPGDARRPPDPSDRDLGLGR